MFPVPISGPFQEQPKTRCARQPPVKRQNPMGIYGHSGWPSPFHLAFHSIVSDAHCLVPSDAPSLWVCLENFDKSTKLNQHIERNTGKKTNEFGARLSYLFQAVQFLRDQAGLGPEDESSQETAAQRARM